MNDEFESIYRAHADAVFRYSLRLTGDRDLAGDITSEAFLALYRNWDSIELSRLPGWLLTVARNRALDHWRKAAIERPYVDAMKEPMTMPLEETDVQSWLRNEPSLKPVHRVCLILHFVHGMTRSEIAQRLAVSETRVKGHLQYALQLLRKAWKCGGTEERHGQD
jgi:RNA polymerase sigma-70 factor (ECF subfamily)